MNRPLLLACVLTLVHFTGSYMRVPIVPLYASAHGATPAQVGLIVGVNAVVAALCAIPLGRASDRFGRRALMLLGVAVSAVTSLALPFVHTPSALAAVYGLAGIGLAAFTPSVMSLVGDVAPRGGVARAFGWYTTALYAAFGAGPIVGGLVADRLGFRNAFFTGAAIVVVSFAIGLALPDSGKRPARSTRAPDFAAVLANPRVWAGWIATLAGLAPWAVTVTFFPLLGRSTGLTASGIGLVLGAQALANTGARLPAGFLIDRTRARAPFVAAGLVGFALSTALLPHLATLSSLIALSLLSGIGYAFAFVAVSAALADASTPSTRGLVMGGYSTAIYIGLGGTAVALGPVIAAHGFATGFTLAAAGCIVATLVAVVLWRMGRDFERRASGP